MTYAFDRFLRYDELTSWVHLRADDAPNLATVGSYGRSHEGRDLWLVTLTDAETGPPETKPAVWIDANIHAVEVTGGVAALYVIDALIDGFGRDPEITRALETRTFYIAPRVNLDGVEWALADQPRYRRSSTRSWPWAGDLELPGIHERDLDGDGRILMMRVPDPDGAWMPSARDPRILAPVPPQGAAAGTPRYRLLPEGDLVDFDGFTSPTPRPPQSLDLNRNFPAGWSTQVTGSGDHPLSEPEIDCLVRAIRARPNICVYNAFHTSGGFLLRPSSTKADRDLPPMDVWTWKQLGALGTAATGYAVHSVYEDFTWDPKQTLSGASDDWAYEHLGIYGWTTEFWDVIHHATGAKSTTHIWYTGPTEDEELAVLAWADANGHTGMFADWYPFEHPQLGPVELGGWDVFRSFDNPPPALLVDEVKGHAGFAVQQALAAPSVEVQQLTAQRLGDDTWRVTAGVANTGYLPTDITVHARANAMVLPLTAVLDGDGAVVLDGPARRELGQLEGRSAARFSWPADGSPNRVLVAWTVRAAGGSRLTVRAAHPRAGTAEASVTLPVEAGA